MATTGTSDQLAIIEAGQGNVFIKMTGPQALVKSASADFKKMIENAVK